MKGKALLFHTFKHKQNYTHCIKWSKLWSEWPPTVHSPPSHAKNVCILSTEWSSLLTRATLKILHCHHPSLSIQKRWPHQPCRSQSELLINPVTGDGLAVQPGMLLSQLSPVPAGLAEPQGTSGCPQHSPRVTPRAEPLPPWAALTVLSSWFGVGPGFGNRSCFWRSRNSRFWLCLRHVWLSARRGKALVNTTGRAQNEIVRMAAANKAIK